MPGSAERDKGCAPTRTGSTQPLDFESTTVHGPYFAGRFAVVLPFDSTFAKVGAGGVTSPAAREGRARGASGADSHGHRSSPGAWPNAQSATRAAFPPLAVPR